MFSNELWQKSGVSTYSIDQSIRFNSADSTYMQRTHGAGGNVDKFSVSFWFKRSNLGTDQYMFGSGADANNTSDINFNTSDQLTFWSYIGGYQTRLITTQVFRDPSAWYHCVVVYDSGNAVSTERARLYINGARVTSFGTETYPSQNQDGIVGSNVNIGFGRYISYGGSYFDGYLAEMNYVNGLALDPSSFGEYNDSGIWIPKEYSGSYGTGGFFVDGRDSADLGDDESGNGNDLTTSGLAAHDQVFDTPVNNFCVLNPISKPSYDSGVTVRGVSGVNLSSISKPSGNTNGFAFGTMGVTSGKWYYELYTTTYPAVEALGLGWIDAENAQTATASGSGWRDFGVNQRHTTSAYSVWQWGSNESTSTGLTEFQASVVVGVATDFDNNTFTLTTNGSAYGSVDFDSTSPTQDLTDGTIWLPKSELANDAVALVTFNFGQDSTFNGQITAGGNADGNGVGNFKYSVPSGYLALCTKNLGS